MFCSECGTRTSADSDLCPNADNQIKLPEISSNADRITDSFDVVLGDSANDFLLRIGTKTFGFLFSSLFFFNSSFLFKIIFIRLFAKPL